MMSMREVPAQYPTSLAAPRIFLLTSGRTLAELVSARETVAVEQADHHVRQENIFTMKSSFFTISTRFTLFFVKIFSNAIVVELPLWYN